MKSHMDDYLADNVDSQYYEKVNKWKQELIASINEAKKLLK